MWILLTKGAVSIVKFNHAAEGDPKTMQVRSRRKEWLAAFAKYMDRNPKFQHDEGTKDYSWRFFATPEEVAAAAGKAVLDVTYSNFKNATSAPGTGLRSVKLRHDLHGAYHDIWDVLLKAGDGTSMYDKKYTKAFYSEADAGTIGICTRLGHWWSKGKESCNDCGTPNPSYPAAGPHGVRATPAEADAWWAAHPEARKPAPKTVLGPAAKNDFKEWQKDLPETGNSNSHLVLEGQCTGSFGLAMKGSLGKEPGKPLTGYCRVCEQPFTFTDKWRIAPHAALDVTEPDDDKPKTLLELLAARDAARDNHSEVKELYDRGEAADEDYDDAIDAYCDAEDAYLAALAAGKAAVEVEV